MRRPPSTVSRAIFKFSWTVKGPILEDLESHADYPREVADWYEAMAREVMRATESAADEADTIARDHGFWRGPQKG